MPEPKKSVVPKGPETPGAMANPFAEATGALDPEVAMHLAKQAISVLSPATSRGDEDSMRRVGSAFKLLEQINPQNELEGLLALQILGGHETAMECLQQSRLPAQTPAGRDTNLKHAVKFMGLYIKQLEALARLRGKSQQKMTVERVNVESGGQAIVGQVDARPSWPTRDADVKAAAAEETLQHEPSDAVNSGSSKKTKKKKKTASKKRA